MPKSVKPSFDPYRPDVVKLRPRAIMLIEIDKQIERLSGQYQEIIQSRSFQMLKTRQGQVDLAFVCFYVILLTARYLGWRCSEIMRCRLETHDGNFMLVVKEVELMARPGKRLILAKDAIQPTILREALRSYAEVVYPFLQTVSERPLDTRLFLSCSRNGIAPFNDALQFLHHFRFNIRRFLPLRDSQAPTFYKLRMLAKAMPEFIEERMIEEARALGDEVDTLKRTYSSSPQLRMLAKAVPDPKEKLMIEAASALGDDVAKVKKLYPSSRQRRSSQ